jgi:cysteinyl-tRNA synthetase
MSVKIYNTLTREKEDFVPRGKEISMYVCGPTVYDVPHIGHARSAYVFDVIRRYFIYKGYDVKFVRNVTDVDDKIINRAKEEFKGEDMTGAVKKVSEKYLEIYHGCMDALGIMPPDRDKEPRATDYIDKMKLFIEGLVKKGVAYVSGGDVYFDVKKAKDYGKLSNQSFEMLESGARVSPGENKKDPLDFALWKSAKEGEVSWPSPWGPGRPGWHIECSVMSSDILGDEFDIHGGGIDLIFPHHENEIAQSEGAGKKFARYWIHNGLLTINKEKMAKSQGNFITIDDVLAKYPADVLKILFLQTHYSHPVDFSWEKMEEAKKAWDRFCILLVRIEHSAKRKAEENIEEEINLFRVRFENAMDDDFNTAEALAVLFEMVTFINKKLLFLTEGSDLGNAGGVLMELGKVFGLFEISAKKKIDKNISEEKIKDLIERRNKARKNKDFNAADRIRKELEAKGVMLEDTKQGTTWRAK